jgi:hypothetical protein
MAAITAAAIAATATIATTAATVATQPSGGGGGGGAPQFKPVPENPQDRAMRNYYARLAVSNLESRYPGFGDYLQSGGAAEKAEFPLVVPEMKPSEAAAFGLVGGRGEQIPGATPAEYGAAGQLTPEQTIYLAQERRRQAATAGQKPGPWATRVQKLGGRIGRLEHRLEKFTPTPEIEPREARIQAKLEKLRGKYETATGA